LKSTIESIEKRIKKHMEKIRNPKKYMERDDPNDPKAVERARKDGKMTSRDETEQRDIAKDELRRRSK
jgi:hypothetical protein